MNCQKGNINIKLNIFIIIVFLLSSCQNKDKDKIVITPRIEYDVLINNQDVETDWWIQKIEGPKRDAFIDKIYNAVINNKLKAYNYKSESILNSAEALKLFKDNSVIKGNYSNIFKIRFREKWLINKLSAEIEKKVLAICPVIQKDSAFIPLFWIKMDTVTTDKDISPISERIQYDVNINNQKLTTENVKLNNTWWSDNIETSSRTNLVDLILNTALSGKSMVYDYFNEPITAELLKKSFTRIDSISSERPYPPYERFDTVIIHQLNKQNITKIRFMEQWFIGQKTLSITKKVIGISPILQVYMDNGEFKGNMPLFWLYFDTNYPKLVVSSKQ